MYKLFFKRMIDALVSFVLLVLFSPILILSSLLIVLSSRGPVFFRQLRVDKNLKTFNILKFRTMTHEKREVGVQWLTVYSNVDNLAAGNIAAPIDEKTGKITGLGVYSDISKGPETFQPVIGVEIVGFQVSWWKESLALAKEAALFDKTNRSIGWDIVVTESGPGLIEGNFDWRKLVRQLPVNEGLKSKLVGYLHERS